MLTELVDYEYYTKTYGGSSIPESSFKEHSINASSKINQYTSRRINEENINDNIKNTACEVANLLFEQEQLKAKLNNDKFSVASETVGPHSITYINKSSLQAQRILSSAELEKECYKICYNHLAHTGLMYRGGE